MVQKDLTPPIAAYTVSSSTKEIIMNEIYWDTRTRQLALAREQIARQERRAKLRRKVMDVLGAVIFLSVLIIALSLEVVPV